MVKIEEKMNFDCFLANLYYFILHNTLLFYEEKVWNILKNLLLLFNVFHLFYGVFQTMPYVNVLVHALSDASMRNLCRKLL